MADVFNDNFWGGAPAWGARNETTSFIADPMDLFGHRAKDTKKKVAEIDYQTAMAGIQAQKDAYKQSIALQRPYYEYGLGSLGQLQNFQAQPFSQQFYDQAEMGEEALLRSQVARGMSRSTDTMNSLGTFYNQLTGDEIGRQRQSLLDDVNVAMGSADSIGAAGANMGANAGNIYSSWGNNAMNNQIAYGVNRANTYTQAGDALGALGYYGANNMSGGGSSPWYSNMPAGSSDADYMNSNPYSAW
jgi:hypothetical protein